MQHESNGLVVIGATVSDAHVVSIYLITIFLQEHGYEVVNLSCCNPTVNFFTALEPGRMPVAIVIANQNGSALADLQDLPALRRKHGSTVPVVLGGHYHVGCEPSESIDRQLYDLGLACIVDSPEALLAFLQGLRRPPAKAAGAPVLPPEFTLAGN